MEILNEQEFGVKDQKMCKMTFDINEKEESFLIVEGINQLAKESGIPVIAIGIDNPTSTSSKFKKYELSDDEGERLIEIGLSSVLRKMTKTDAEPFIQNIKGFPFLEDANELVEKIWGSELWIVNNDVYCGKLLSIEEGKRCSMHHHNIKHETFYVLNGKVWMEIGGVEFIMHVGQRVTVRPGVEHRFTGLENGATILEFSTHHTEEDSYRSTESEEISKEEFSQILEKTK